MRRPTPVMARILAYALLAVLAIVPLAAPSHSTASPAPISLTGSVQVSFPNSITFDVKAQLPYVKDYVLSPLGYPLLNKVSIQK